jgi:threonine dehydratase
MHMRRRIAGERVGVVLSGGNITSQQLSSILHGELLPHAERSAVLAAQLADMEYGARNA